MGLSLQLRDLCGRYGVYMALTEILPYIHPVTATYIPQLPRKLPRKEIFREMEWDVGLSLQLRDLCGRYGVYMALTGFTWPRTPP